MARLTKRQQDETVSVFYGLNPRTLEVDTVYVTRGGDLTKWTKAGNTHTHHNSHHPNDPRTEIIIVYELTDLIETSPELTNDKHTKLQLAELEAKAAFLRTQRGTENE
jgi:hypothetical protein